VKTSMLKSRTGAAVGKVTIEAFRRGFCGRTLLPGDAGYDSASRIWNASIDKHPVPLARLRENPGPPCRGFPSQTQQGMQRVTDRPYRNLP